MNTADRRLDTATLRRLAVDSGADPRTVARVYRGEPVRGMVRDRVRAVLIEAGLLSPTGERQ